MKNNKEREELRAQSVAELETALMSLLKEHFNLRMQHRSAQLSDTTKLAKVKKSIARIKTIMKEKQQ